MTNLPTNYCLNDYQLDLEKLPSLPSVAMEIVRLCRDDEVALDELAQVVSVDPSLAAKIIRLANSPKYRRKQELTDIQRACFVLGIKTLKIMALGFSITQATMDRDDSSGFDYDAYWAHSVACAVSAREFSHLINAPCEDEAFLCGLFSRIGQMAMAKTMQEPYEELTRHSETSLPTACQEKEIFGFNHHDVAEKILRLWEVPEKIICGTTRWSDPVTQEADRKLCQIVRIADCIASMVHEPKKGENLIAAYHHAQEDFGLDQAEVDGFVVMLNEEVSALAKILNVKIQSSGQLQNLIDDARSEILEISLQATIELESAHIDLQKEKQRNNRLASESAELQKKWQMDSLTQIPNRGAFDSKLRQEIGVRLDVQSTSVGIMMIDVDHFKSFNDTYGHLVGDIVLQRVAATIKESVRPTDFVARYGGEEFVVVLPNTDEAAIKHVAERTRQLIESQELEHEGEILKVTASIGATFGKSFHELGDGISLIKAADDQLYQAKESGRNRCCIAEMRS